jgi:hypothetical protein
VPSAQAVSPITLARVSKLSASAGRLGGCGLNSESEILCASGAVCNLGGRALKCTPLQMQMLARCPDTCARYMLSTSRAPTQVGATRGGIASFTTPSAKVENGRPRCWAAIGIEQPSLYDLDVRHRACIERSGARPHRRAMRQYEAHMYGATRVGSALNRYEQWPSPPSSSRRHSKD